MALFTVLGKAPSGARLQRILHSPDSKEGVFQNLTPTPVTAEGVGFFKMLGEYRRRPKDTVPDRPLPSVRTDLKALPSDRPVIVWFGHSSYLIKVKEFHILVDPVFSGNASPVSFFARAFPGADVYGVEDLPDIDLVLLTHDHYDHLDYKTILKLIPKTSHFYTSLGVGSHLEYWGIAPSAITELDWWEGTRIDGTGRGIEKEISLTATPARHFSGRGIKRGRTLWSSFVLNIDGYTLFLGGDSGYGSHFAAIGDRFGPFDLAILECGQYGKNWPYIHMLPEQTVAAAIDLRAKKLLPVHWGKFTLALHPWNEPIRRVTAEAEKKGIPILTPLIGEAVIPDREYLNKKWWEFT
jgi:L-ascorbate metabolism protein UlaG (beta-lactamase superfamily)